MTPLQIRRRLRAALLNLRESPDNVVTFPVRRRTQATLHWMEGIPGQSGVPELLDIDLSRAGRLHPRAMAERLRTAAAQLDAEADARLDRARQRGEQSRARRGEG